MVTLIRDWLSRVGVLRQTPIGSGYARLDRLEGAEVGGVDGRLLAPALHPVPATALNGHVGDHFEVWRTGLRSTFMFLGWLCGAEADDAALRAAARVELLHAFALLQDDVMDGSELRRGRPSAHVRLAAGIASADCRVRRTASASRRPCCSPTCAWCGRSRCCGTVASARQPLPGRGPGRMSRESGACD